jgi:hypothetical protein
LCIFSIFSLFIHQLISIYADLAIMNTAVINIGMQVSLLYADLHSFEYMPSSTEDHIIVVFLVFEELPC